MTCDHVDTVKAHAYHIHTYYWNILDTFVYQKFDLPLIMVEDTHTSVWAAYTDILLDSL